MDRSSTVALRSIIYYLSVSCVRPEVLDLLLDRSKNDPDKQVRKFAEEELVKWRSRSIS